MTICGCAVQRPAEAVIPCPALAANALGCCHDGIAAHHLENPINVNMEIYNLGEHSQGIMAILNRRLLFS